MDGQAQASEEVPGGSPPGAGMAAGDVLEAVAAGLEEAMIVDRAAIAARLARLRARRRRGVPVGAQARALAARLERSRARRARREALAPAVTIDPGLPIAAAGEAIAAAIAAHPVTVVAGETGCGKSTQLPKICLALGRGRAGAIALTQPRRIAARGVAERLAAELDSPLGEIIGYQVRFGRRISSASLVRVVTDGVLLAQLQRDPRLLAYDTVIVDEVHERSLDIDLLLGLLRELVGRRPELRVVLSSATLDTARLAEFFAGAPVIEVGGRGHPVEIRHCPPPEGCESDLPEQVEAALATLGSGPPGDVLVFLAGEREIHDTARHLRRRLAAGSEVLELYGRMPLAEQRRIFEPHRPGRVILATNVAETSLTVPGIRYVIDTGLARISRFGPRSAVQRLPVEPISQASATQRAGRCGRLGPGVCVRLYSAEDLAARPAFTEPEVLRTHLASLLLRIQALGYDDPARFPFLDRPDRRRLNDARRLLAELGALDEQGRLTALGERLARLPLDPRIGRMLLAGETLGCLDEVLVVAAALSIPDPRERPAGRERDAARARSRLTDERSDFSTLLRLWQAFQGREGEGFHRFCRRLRLSPVRMREWCDVHAQLAELAAEMGLRRTARPATYARLHRAILAGLLRNVGVRDEDGIYLGPRDLRFRISRASAQHGQRPRCVVCAELVETGSGVAWAQRVARVRAEWIEEAAGARLRRDYYGAHWDSERGEAMVFERTSLYGLTLVARRRVRYAPVNRAGARELFIRGGLVEGGLRSRAPALRANRELAAALRGLDQRLRRPDVQVDDEALHAFYERRLPREVCDRRGFEAWWPRCEREEPGRLRMRAEDVRRGEPPAGLERDFPGHLHLAGHELALSYRFAPGEDEDGITVTVPAGILAELDPGPFEWLVPGRLAEKVEALLRMLPKGLRRELVPIAETAAGFVAACGAGAGRGSLHQALRDWLLGERGVLVAEGCWEAQRLAAALPAHLRMRFRVLGPAGEERGCGRDLHALQRALAARAPRPAAPGQGAPSAGPARRSTGAWVFGPLPEEVRREGPRGATPAWPALLDRGDAVTLELLESRAAARRAMPAGLRRLFALALGRDARRWLREHPAALALELGYAALPEPPEALGALPDTDLGADLAALAAGRALLEGAGAIRDRAAFEARIAERRAAFRVAFEEACALCAELLERYRALRALAAAGALAALPASRADVDEQLAWLVHRGFAARAGWERLSRYPRYLEALRLRLERIATGGANDARRCAEIAPLWRRYVVRAAAHRARGRHDPELERYRWMIEEYRVSLFAQRLGTAEPVSRQRLDAQWRRVSG